MAGADRIQERSISHTGSELGEEYVELSENKPDEKTAIVSFEGPRKYESLRYRGERHYTKLALRTHEEHTGDTLELDARIQPIAGEEDLDDQPFPAVVVGDENGEEVEIEDVDYATNTVTLDDDHGTVHAFPVISQGAVQYQGVNQFGQNEGSLNKWTTPVYRWLDFDQDKRGTEVNLQGEATWTRYEKLVMVLESPETVVWEHDNYPLGSYVSHVEQRVDIEL